MQKKKNIFLLISFVVLAIACVVTYFSIHADSSLNVDTGLFKVDDFKTIDRIVMKTQQRNVELNFADNRWSVNGRYPADRNLVDVLFATLQQAVPKRPVAARLRDSISNELEKSGTHVSLYSGNELKKEFLAGGNAQRTQAYFREVNGKTPYIVTIPGYRVYTSGILELDENGWRDKHIFVIDWQKFKKLTATFPRDSKKNFTVVMKNRVPEIEGLAEADTSRLYTFMDDVSLLTADEFASNADSLKNSQPIMQISIEDIASRNYSVEFFSKLPQSNQFPGLVQGTDPALFDGRKVERVLKSREYFLGK
ncbi:MAG TPA: DUF4340 domain-containing protein [Cyclobacteriaceae bacterium]|nr:DUF4340 domain-containing protein [Cyclobacteriaceae bacterium]